VQGVNNIEVLFGTHTSLSGPAADWGTESVNGMRMRFDEVNASGGVQGRDLKLIVEDHQYQVPRAIQAANKLLNRDRIFAMISALGTPMNNAVMQRQLQQGVPNLFPYSGARSMGHPPHRLKFTATPSYYDATRAGLRYLIENNGYRTVCVQYQNTDYGREVYEAVVDELEGTGLAVAGEAVHQPTDTEFTASVSKLQAANCDIVVLGTIVRDTILIANTVQKLDWTVALLGTVAAYSTVVVERGGEAIEGLYATTPFRWLDERSAGRRVKRWISAYTKQYGHPPGAAAMAGYSSASIVAVALRRTGRDITVDKFIDALEGMRGYKTLFGNVYSFGPNRHNGLPSPLIAQVKSNTWRRIAGPLPTAETRRLFSQADN
jgi:branched-chain amino acid transport system substrate-binding protein